MLLKLFPFTEEFSTLSIFLPQVFEQTVLFFIIRDIIISFLISNSRRPPRGLERRLLPDAAGVRPLPAGGVCADRRKVLLEGGQGPGGGGGAGGEDGKEQDGTAGSHQMRTRATRLSPSMDREDRHV